MIHFCADELLVLVLALPFVRWYLHRIRRWRRAVMKGER